MAVSREKLYEEVWAEPMTSVAKRYDVSSNFLARVCERLNVPHPSRGYWARRAAGIKLNQPVLLAAEPGGEVEWVRDGSEPKRQPMTADSPRPRRSKSTRPEKHPLLVSARAHFDHARESREEQYVRPYKRNLVDVFVSKNLIDEALKVANELFLALEDRGHRVMLAPTGARFHHTSAEVCEGNKEQQGYYHSSGHWSPARPTIVLVSDTTIGLTVFELSEEVEVRYDSTLHKYVRVNPVKTAVEKKVRRAFAQVHRDWTTKHWMPSGRLGLHAYAAQPGIDWERYWREAKPGELSGLFDAIAKELNDVVPTIKELVVRSERKAEEQRLKWEAQQREWKRQEAERQRVVREAQREKEITETISKWRMARDVRAYAAEIQALVKDADLKITEGSGADQELKWALAYADRIDPLMSWREDIARVMAEHDCKPCPKCGKAHRAEGVATEGAEGAAEGPS